MTSHVQAGTAPAPGLSSAPWSFHASPASPTGSSPCVKGEPAPRSGVPPPTACPRRWWCAIPPSGAASPPAGRWDRPSPTPPGSGTPPTSPRWCAWWRGTSPPWTAWRGGWPALRRPVDAVWHALRRNTRDRKPPQHRRPLRPGRRLLRAHARPHHDLLLRGLRAAGVHPGGGQHRQDRPALPACCGSARRTTSSRSAPAGAPSPSTPPPATGAGSPPPPSRRNQLARARRRVADAGLSDRVTVLHSGLPRPHRTLRQAGLGGDARGGRRRLLRRPSSRGAPPCSRTTASWRSRPSPSPTPATSSTLRGVDFIKRYVFPGSNIPSITALLQAATRSSDLTLRQLDDIGPHYATHAGRLAGEPGPQRRRGGAAHRRALPAHLELLPLLLRGRLRRAVPGRRPDALQPSAREGLTCYRHDRRCRPPRHHAARGAVPGRGPCERRLRGLRRDPRGPHLRRDRHLRRDPLRPPRRPHHRAARLGLFPGVLRPRLRVPGPAHRRARGGAAGAERACGSPTGSGRRSCPCHGTCPSSPGRGSTATPGPSSIGWRGARSSRCRSRSPAGSTPSASSSAGDRLPNGLVRVRFEPTSFFLRVLAPSLEGEYDPATRRLVRYVGVSNVAAEDGSPQKVEIAYSYPEPAAS